MLKENKGITLVALVITIIVLLILAGVSISLVEGDNGVLGQATNASDKTNTSTVKEQVQLAVSSASSEWYALYYAGNLTTAFASWIDEDKIEANLSSAYSDFTYGGTGHTSSVVYNGVKYEFTITINNNSGVVGDVTKADSQ